MANNLNALAAGDLASTQRSSLSTNKSVTACHDRPMRTDMASIFTRELEKALDDGLELTAATAQAKESAERIYYELVDRGRQEAKDRER